MNDQNDPNQLVNKQNEGLPAKRALSFIKAIIKWFEKNALYSWTSVWMLFGLLLGFVVLYNFSKPSTKFDFGIIFLWALAYFLLGALVGCIFGVPKAVTGSVTKTDPVTTNNTLLGNNPAALPGNNFPSITETTSAGASNSPTNNPPTHGSAPNNLTEISEWLAKIVVGAGLVELKQIPAFVLKVANKMSTGIDLQTHQHSTILCAGLLVYYSCFGLIAGYFIMRTIFLKYI